MQATPPGQAPVQVHDRLIVNVIVFKQVFDQVDASAWPVELVTQQLIGGACSGAKPTMNTTSQYAVRLFYQRQVNKLRMNTRLH